MKEDTQQPKTTRLLITAAAFVIIVAGIREAKPILIPFLLSAFIAVLSAPLLLWLKRKGLPSIIAILIVVAGFLGIGLIIAAMLGTSLDNFSRDLPVYNEQLKERIGVLLTWLEHIGINSSDKRILEAFDPGAAMKLVAGMLTGLSEVLTNVFMILLAVIFILLEASSFPDKIRLTVSDPDKSFGYFYTFIDNVQRYIKIKTLASLATGIAVAVWLAILGVEYPVLWGLLAFLLNYVPNIGSILAAVPAILLALIQLGGASALLTASGYIVVNFVIGSIIEPRFMGRGLGLSTLVVFISLVFWGWVLGPVGMFLSVPLTMTLMIAFDSNEDTRWIAVLLASEASIKNDINVQPEKVNKDS